MKKLRRPLLIIIGLLLLLGIGDLSYWLYAKNTSNAQPNQNTACTVNANTLLTLINSERAKIGSPALVVDPQLSISSRNKLDNMVLQKYYGHNQIDGSSWSVYAQNQGVKASISEDINVNALSSETLWSSYKNSPSHYQSLTNPSFTRVGVATQCTNFILEKSTGPSDNSNLIGKNISDLTVVHLASPEPIPPSQTTNCEYRYSDILGRGYSTCN